MFDFTGQTVLITGASYGLGEVFAQRYAAAGADLVLTARSTDLLEAVADECRAQGSRVTTVTGDVSVEDDVTNVVSSGIEAHGSIDVLVNNAGISEIRGFAAERFPTDVFDTHVAVDLKGAWLYLREVGRHMLEGNGGSIVNICSIMASGANELNVIAYTAAKGALRNLTQQLGCEWADRGVRVNAVSPGFIMTDMIRSAVEGTPNADYIASRTPMRRFGEAEEVANAVLFLSSDLAGYITGHDLLVDGGTNAGNGWWQVPPIHYEWNRDTHPQVPGRYEGLQPRPAGLEAMADGIPGVHFPLPDA